MTFEDCFELGKITKAHGLQGFVTIFIDSDFPQNYYEMESVLVEINKDLVPFFILDAKESSHPQKIHVLFEDVESKDDTQDLIGSRLFLPSEVLPELTGNQFYYHDIIGFKIVDKTLGDIGEITQVFENTGNDFFELLYNKQKVLIPIVDHFLKEVDRENKVVNMDLPEGLLDL